MITITTEAASALRALIAEKALDASSGLRLSIERGGCAGLQYAMEIGASQADDETIERDGARVFIDHESALMLEGSTIDYEDGLAGSGFRIINPGAARSCGCGTSFEPVAPPASEGNS